MEMKDIRWKDLKVGDEFADGSKVTQIHTTLPYMCYKITSLELFERKQYETIVSGDHVLLCNISQSSKKIKRLISKYCKQGSIPIEEDMIVKPLSNLDTKEEKAVQEYLKTGASKFIKKFENMTTALESYDIDFCDEKGEFTRNVQIIVDRNSTKAEMQIVDKDNVWLSVDGIRYLMRLEPSMKIYSGNSYIQKIEVIGQRDAFCVSTDSGQYKVNGLIHHNSVALRNIIFHCITHSNEIQIALVDLKITEFTQFKNMNGVVAVCNSVREACEVMRIARNVMYKRNHEMAKYALTDVNDYHPKDVTDKIWISGRAVQEDEILTVKMGDEEKQMTAKEVLAFVEQ